MPPLCLTRTTAQGGILAFDALAPICDNMSIPFIVAFIHKTTIYVPSSASMCRVPRPGLCAACKGAYQWARWPRSVEILADFGLQHARLLYLLDVIWHHSHLLPKKICLVPAACGAISSLQLSNNGRKCRPGARHTQWWQYCGNVCSAAEYSCSIPRARYSNVADEGSSGQRRRHHASQRPWT